MKKYGKNIADVLSVNHYIENNDQHKLAVNQIDHIYIYIWISEKPAKYAEQS